MVKITERTYNAITKRFNDYMELQLPHLLGDEIAWYGDVDKLEEDGTYEWRCYDEENNKSYRLICDWNKKKVHHFTMTGDVYARRW